MKRPQPQTVPLVLSALVLAALAGCRDSGWTTINEKPEVFRTYPYGDPDPVPMFVRPGETNQRARLYPYFPFDGFSRTAVDKAWNVVRLENPHLSVAVLPQAGGKVWSATDESDGRDFLYTNHVMKFREIALRGPWTSGGIELNFGILGHTPSTASPVDYVMLRNEDDSVSCVVGNFDLPSRTFWSVEVNLPRDAAFFRTRSRWFNPTPFRQSYYSWMTAALPTADDLEYIAPGRYWIEHDYGRALDTWPVDRQGRDLSKYRNNAFGPSKSYFTVGELAEASGAYYRKDDHGFGHWARFDDMPGRKIWIWDLARAGAIWVGLLTDADGQYTEPQYGRLLNQSDHEFLTPGRTDRWTELWFPYRGLEGPMTQASPWAVLKADRAGQALGLALYALQPIDDDLKLTAGGREIHRTRVRLETSGVFKAGLSLPDASSAFEIRLGAEKLVYRSDPTADDLSRPFAFRPDDESTAEGVFLAADRLHKERRYGEALERYLACAARDPRHVRALTRAAEICCRRGQYDQAAGLARKALEVALYDPDANYIFGVVSRRLGRTADARDALGWAARSLEHRSNAYALMAEIALLEDDAGRAIEYAGRAIEADGDNLNALDLLATTLRLVDEAGRASGVLERILRADPLHHRAYFERYLLEPGPASLRDFQSRIRGEFPEEICQELAHAYLRIGLVAEASILLRLAPGSPTALAWLAYLAGTSSPAESAALLDAALGLSARLVFPFREEDIPVFEWAVRERPGHWKPKYYLALILWSKGRLDEARELLEACGDADFAPLFLARAALYGEAAYDKAEADLSRAVAIEPRDWRARHALNRIHLERGRVREALEATSQALAAAPDAIALKSDRVEALLAANAPGEAAVILDGIEALPSEGASALHSLFVRCRIMLAAEAARKRDYAGALVHLDLAKTYPERFGTGRPFDPDGRVQDYLRSLCLDKLGRGAEALAARKAVAELTLQNPGWTGGGRVVGAFALIELGRRAEAGAIAREQSARADDELASWIRAFR